MDKVRFGIAGCGWRAMAYVNAARQSMGRFEVTGMTSRTPEKRLQLEAQLGIGMYETWEALVEHTKPDFLVVAVAKGNMPQVLAAAAQSGIPVLSETFLSTDEDSLLALWEAASGGSLVQFAEQFHLQPMAQARLRIVKDGILGNISQAQVSVSQSYHGISLMRAYLGTGFSECFVEARTLTVPTRIGPDKNGDPQRVCVEPYAQTLGLFDFGGRTGLFDNVREQQFSWFRFERLLVRGEQGEILNGDVRFVRDLHTPVSLHLVRRDLGHEENLEGAGLRCIMLGERCVYENPFRGLRMTDDEIAIATLLANMKACLCGEAQPLYPLREALEDQYLALLMQRAAKTGIAQRTQPRPWSL